MNLCDLLFNFFFVYLWLIEVNRMCAGFWELTGTKCA